VAREDLVEGVDRSEIEVRLPAEIPPDLVQMPVVRFEGELHAGEEGVPRRGMSGEVRADRRLVGGGVPILLPPEVRGLPEALSDASAFRLAVFLDQLRLEFRRRLLH